MSKTSPTRPAPGGIESLETRKLFFGGGHFAPPHLDGLANDAINMPFGHNWGGGNGGGYQRNLLFGGGAMVVMIAYDPMLAVTAVAAGAATPSATNAAVATTEATPTASSNAAVPANAASDDVATRILINTVPPKAEAVAVKTAGADDATDVAPAMTPVVPVDTSPAAAAAPAVRFSFASIGAAVDHGTHTSSGLIDLLSRSRPAAGVVVLPATAAPTGHAGAANGPAAPADAEPDAAAAILPTAAQSALAALPGAPVAGQPLWQRLAVATAGAVLVSANWIVRRRARKTALAGGPGRRA